MHVFNEMVGFIDIFLINSLLLSNINVFDNVREWSNIRKYMLKATEKKKFILPEFNWSYPCKQHLHGKLHFKRSQYIMKYLVIVIISFKAYMLTVPYDVSFQFFSPHLDKRFFSLLLV